MGVGVVIGGSGGEGSLRRGSGDEWVKEDWLAKRLEFVTESMGLQERRLWALAWGWDYIRRASDERGWDLVSSVSWPPGSRMSQDAAQAGQAPAGVRVRRCGLTGKCS